MALLKLTMVSPCVVYQDTVASSNALAQRPATLQGKVVGLIPNWRPAAVHLLTAVGNQLKTLHGVKGSDFEVVETGERTVQGW